MAVGINLLGTRCGTMSEGIAVTVSVKVAEAKTHLSELLARVKAREDFIISRGNDPEARLVAMDERWPRSKR